MIESKRQQHYQNRRDKEQDLLWRLLNSRDRYHLMVLLLTEILKDTTPEYLHGYVNKIVNASKDDVAQMLLDYRRIKMPKGGATYMAQWLRIENGEVVVFKTGLVASPSAEKEKTMTDELRISEAIELLEKGEVAHIDPFDRLLNRIKDAWKTKDQSA